MSYFTADWLNVVAQVWSAPTPPPLVLALSSAWKKNVKPKTECDMRSCQAQFGSTTGGQSYVWKHRVPEWCVKCLSGTLQCMTAWRKRRTVRLCVCVHLRFRRGWKESARQASPLRTFHPLVDFPELPVLPLWQTQAGSPSFDTLHRIS